MSEIKTLRIGTRASALALKQAEWVKSFLGQKSPALKVVLVKIKTEGDKLLNDPLTELGGKGVFVKEIEEALIRREIDVAVHSLKDLPTEIPEGLSLEGITERVDPRDVIISRENIPLRDLPKGAKLGTGSLRRRAQLLNFRPDLEILPIRGNLDTRLRKLTTEGLDAIIVAAAGIKRMGWEDKISEYLPFETCLPAVGQGALGLEIRVDDKEVNNLIKLLDHPPTAGAIRAERAFLKRLGGGCQVPIAARGDTEDGRLRLSGIVASVDGTQLVRDSISGEPSRAEPLGIELAERLLTQGAEEIIEQFGSL
ncbi:MAG: hydroxymethylbilane synthase [Deltaproteobacteria bacterium]|nr:MAG: hydroxymethylbilane synthase [Deltaproteobacteria bacterium]